MCAGLPLTQDWKTLGFGILSVYLFTGTVQAGWRRFAGILLLASVVAGGRLALPRVDLQEGHNFFILKGEGDFLAEALPPTIYRDWKTQFDSIYGGAREPYPGAWQWKNPSLGPDRLFASSSDAFWRPARFSRAVDSVFFRSLAEFRGGFANDLRYNFYLGNLLREKAPFYVFYEIPASATGGKFRWQGSAFWQAPGGGVEPLPIAPDQNTGELALGPEHVGGRFWAAFFPVQPTPFFLQFSAPPRLGWVKITDLLLAWAGWIGVCLLCVRPRWGAFFRNLCVPAVAYGLTMLATFHVARHSASGTVNLGGIYPPFCGGDDGLVHEGFGHRMAQNLWQGKVSEALEGCESVYWFTPGMRYFRMVEKIIFGDTNQGHLLVLLFLSLAVFHLLTPLIGPAWAWAGTAYFLAAPAGNLSFLQYLILAKNGYGETVATCLFFAGLAALFRQSAKNPSSRAILFGAGACLAAAVFIRPNFALAAATAGLIFTARLWIAQKTKPALSLVAGLALGLWMPWHNWHYGEEFYLISKSGATIMIGPTPSTYLHALQEWVSSAQPAENLATARRQVSAWLGTSAITLNLLPRWVSPVFHGLKLLALFLTAAVFCRGLLRRTWLRPAVVLSAVALAAHLPMFFVSYTDSRYAFLGWDLSLLTLLVWAHAWISGEKKDSFRKKSPGEGIRT